MSNQSAFEVKNIVKNYSIQDQLQKPEETILNIFRDKLKDMKMLDIGVGAGRTTRHFAHLTKQYIGIDYSKNMIETCRKKFQKLVEGHSFMVCDARAMTIFENSCFDFILFSFNGLDYISNEDRLKTLREIKRVGKKGGRFCFSSHNLNTDLENSFKIKFTPNPIKLTYRVCYYLSFKLLTMNFKRRREHAQYLIINDGAREFRLSTYYIKPEAQINQLTHLGFKDIKIFSLSDGKEIKDKSVLNTVKDSWLYYLCEI
jgi:ubiquinone/menaquinone biosynthesis C-methylase UbiE